ncbi:MAG: GumC family protein [Pyrinomonadaceae bacterium]
MRYLQRINRPAPAVKRLYGRKLLIVTILVLVVATGMAATFLITPKYEATMSIFVSRDRIDPQITSSDKAVDMMQKDISDEEFNSELELFKSLDAISAVVKELDLVNDQSPKNDTALSQWRGRIKNSFYDTVSLDASTAKQPAGDDNLSLSLEKAVNRVAANLEVIPAKKSRVIKVTYTDTDPVRAKKTLEAIYRKFVELHVELSEKPEVTQVFNEQTGKFSEQLSAATNELKSFDTGNGVIGADIATQQGLLQKQLSDTQAQTNSARTQIGETLKRIASLQAKIAGEPEQLQTGYVSKYVPALDRMKEELIQLEQQRTQLLQKYQPNSRFVRENQERIDQLRRTLATETANPPQERSFAINELRRKLEAELYQAQTDLAALRDREKTLTAQAAKLDAEVTHLNTKSIERAELERKKNINEEAFLLYQKKARENEIGQIFNKEKILNFSVIDPPRTDGQQKNPKPLLNLLVLLGVGTLAGFAGALVLDKLAARDDEYDMVRSPYEIERRLAVPLLASIPMMELPSNGEKYVGKRRALSSGETAVETEAV